MTLFRGYFSSSAFVANISSSWGYGGTLLLSGVASVLPTPRIEWSEWGSMLNSAENLVENVFEAPRLLKVIQSPRNNVFRTSLVRSNGIRRYRAFPQLSEYFARTGVEIIDVFLRGISDTRGGRIPPQNFSFINYL